MKTLVSAFTLCTDFSPIYPDDLSLVISDQLMHLLQTRSIGILNSNIYSAPENYIIKLQFTVGLTQKLISKRDAVPTVS